MAKFRQGDLVLQSTQSIWQGSAERLRPNGEGYLYSLEFESGVKVDSIDADITLSGDSNSNLVTQKAIKTYVDSEIASSVPTGTNESIVRYNGSTGIQDSSVFIDDLANVTGVKSLTTSGEITAGGDVSISGNLTVDGTTFIINSQEVTTADNLIVINSGELGAGVTAGSAGIEVDRGSLTNYQFLFDEVTDSFRTGEIGSLQAVSTREDTPTDQSVPYWDDSNTMFSTVDTPFKKNGVAAELYYDGNLALTTGSYGTTISDTLGDDPQLRLKDNSNVLQGRFWTSNGNVYLDSSLTSKSVYIRGYNGSTYENLIQCTQGGDVSLYYNNDLTLQTISTGINVYDTAGDDPRVELYDSSQISQGKLWTSNGNVFLDASLSAKSVNMRGYNGSTYDNLFRATQGGSFQLFYDGSVVAETTSVGITADSINLTSSSAISWEDGVNWITNNDGGGNVQIRFGHKFDVSEIFTQDAGTAFYIGGSLDGATGALVLKVASNGAASGILGTSVSWGGSLSIESDDLSWTGSTFKPVSGSGNINLGSSPSGSTAIEYNGYFYATKVFNAVWG